MIQCRLRIADKRRFLGTSSYHPEHTQWTGCSDSFGGETSFRVGIPVEAADEIAGDETAGGMTDGEMTDEENRN